MKTTRFAALLALYLEAPMGFGLLSMKLRRTLPLSLTSPGLRLRFKVQCRVRTLMLNQDPHRSARMGLGVRTLQRDRHPCRGDG